MARGAIPDPELPNVAPRPLPIPTSGDLGATPDTFGAGAARTAQRFGAAAQDLFQQAKQDADQSAVMGALGQAKQALNDIVLDPEKGYASLRGQDAMAGRDKALSQFGKTIDGISTDLTPDQQRMFAPHAVTIREQGFSHVIQHETHEQNQYALAQFRGNVDQTMVTMQNPAVIADAAGLKRQIDELWQTGIDEAKRRYGENASKGAIASVIVPELQKAALGGMESAVAMSEETKNPAIAAQAFDQLGKYMVTGHQRFYAGVVQKLGAQAAVKTQTDALFAAATDTVPVPGGDPIPKVDAVKLAAGLAKADPASPYAADVEREAARREGATTRVWNAAVGSVFSRVESAALKGGGFDTSRASVADLEWLRQNAPGELLKLQAQERRGDSAEAKAASAEAFSSLSADMADPSRRGFYSNLTTPEFVRLTVDQGLAPQDRIKAVKLYGGILKQDLTEKVNRTVAEQLAAALPFSKDQRDKLQGPLLDATNEFIDRTKAESQGKGPTTAEIRKFVGDELVQGKVLGTGIVFNDRMRRIEFEQNPAYANKQFVTGNEAPPAPATPAAAAVSPTTIGPAGQTVPPIDTSTPVREPGFAGYRFSADRKTRFPADAKGNRLGPNEPAP